MIIFKIAKHLLTWWNGTTFGTSVFTRLHGNFVGEDALGNRYFQTKDGKRRWVIYHLMADASKIGAGWHGWLHHTYDDLPTTLPLARKSWEKQHVQNLTGTDQAYHPSGSLSAEKIISIKHYEAWKPE